MSIAAFNTTTLAAAITGSATRFAVASTANIVAGARLVVGAEVMTVQSVPASGTVEVQRGQVGTKARAHANGVTTYIGTAGSFGFVAGLNGINGAVELVGSETGAFPPMVLPVGSVRVDPDTGYEYMLVDCQAAVTIGQWVAIDGAGAATVLAAGSRGRVGVMVESTVSASDTLAWALVAGVSTVALFSSGVTTACYLIAGTGQPDILITTDANIIWGAMCTSAPSSATDVGTAYLDHPWVSGVNTAFSST